MVIWALALATWGHDMQLLISTRLNLTPQWHAVSAGRFIEHSLARGVDVGFRGSLYAFYMNAATVDFGPAEHHDMDWWSEYPAAKCTF